MKKTYALVFLSVICSMSASAQKITLKKGEIIENLPVNDSLSSTFSLFLPSNFTTDRQWPLLVVFDMEGKERQALSMFLISAEKEGYVLAAPKVLDSVSITNNMVTTLGTIESVVGMLPIKNERIYTAGTASGGRFASLTPTFIKGIKGVMTISASLANTELLSSRQSFHFIGMVNRSNYNYPTLLADEKLLDTYKFPNHILLFDGSNEWPTNDYLSKGMQLFTLQAMGRKWIPKDSAYIENAFKEDLEKVNTLKNSGKFIWAEQYLGEMMSMYGAHKNLDSLRLVQKELRRNKQFRAMRREEQAAFLKESLLKQDYQYYMEEDMLTYNFNNLGWWNYQMTEINKFVSSANTFEVEMGNRLLGFVNALAADNIQMVLSNEMVDEDALAFLYMLKTLLEPENFDFYLKTVSLSAKNEDFGTALFYLEEALKKGFKDKDRLYGLEHTALFRITPEFNTLVSKYLKDALYDTIEEE
jgi:hypothetical protein